jgi:DNA-binding transcriptional ArsR family regulator
MFDIQVIDDPATAAVAMEPTRSRILSELAAPASAATVATRVGLARQKVNYHLRALEDHGLVTLAEERKWGGLTERLLVATAASFHAAIARAYEGAGKIRFEGMQYRTDIGRKATF